MLSKHYSGTFREAGGKHLVFNYSRSIIIKLRMTVIKLPAAVIISAPFVSILNRLG